MGCISLDALPQEVTFNVFSQLSPSECRQILSRIQSLSPSRSRQRVIGWLYARLYGFHSIIYIDNERPTDCDFAATPAEILVLSKDEMFLANVPRKLELAFTRDVREYTQFQQGLFTFGEMISAPWAKRYFSEIPEISFRLDGQSTSEGSPTSMSVAVLNSLANLTKLRNANLCRVSIAHTKIGEMFPDKWATVFRCFDSIEHLALEDNSIQRLRTHDPTLSAQTCHTWPSRMRMLSLARNCICTLTGEDFAQLPCSLESLDLSSNNLISVGGHMGSNFTLSSVLPNLKVLNLSDNTFLTTINPEILEEADKFNNVVRILLLGCKFEPHSIQELRERGNERNVKIVI